MKVSRNGTNRQSISCRKKKRFFNCHAFTISPPSQKLFFMKGKKFLKNLHACSLVIVITVCHFLLHHPYNYRRLLTGFFWIKQPHDDVIYQAWDAVFRHQMKHREENWKYDAQQSIFGELQGVSCSDETLLNAWYYFSIKLILEGEIKYAKNEQIFIWLH